MLKTSFKAFVYSFSVSLFAIIAASRAIKHENISINQPLNIENKNIVLFLKNSIPAKYPSKKIALNTLPELNPKVDISPSIEPEVIVASEFDDFDFPLEVVSAAQHSDDVLLVAENNEIAPTDVLYAPDKPLDVEQVEAEVVYQPEISIAQLPAPTHSTPKNLSKNNTVSSKVTTPPLSKDELILANARNAELAPIPLSKGNSSASGKQINVGNPANLNHVAMNSVNIPIQSVEKDVVPTDASNTNKEGGWQSLNDSPWLVAKSSGGKNLMNIKEFGDKTNQEIAKVLDVSTNRSGVNVASETVKNIVIPIPKDIMQKEDLTPKLAYPATSEDAQKEKAINDEIKKQTEPPLAEKKEQSLLVPIEEDISLDVTSEKTEDKTVKPPLAPDAKAKSLAAKNGKSGIMNALNSIFSGSTAPAAEKVKKAKEKAMAKAQARKSIKKRTVKNRPVSIMPTEIRLSFQPNKAEISGQTLRWVQAFAAKTAETPSMMLEIRIDGTSTTELQQRRLNLLYNILTNKGVEYSKISTVFTSREPNSFILRTISVDTNKGETTGKINNRRSKEYIQW